MDLIKSKFELEDGCSSHINVPSESCCVCQSLRVKRLEKERYQALENYHFMVNRACDQKLDGYRELGKCAAKAENERDYALAEIKRLKEGIDAAFEWAGNRWDEWGCRALRVCRILELVREGKTAEEATKIVAKEED